ncbi:MAG: twin-arginine translocase TatA/TatE family subunit [Actinobacteria bacterium]|nr:twin-arginine translocase TatA/TatE family subunit [Actinomycetota bacterium]
MPQGWEWVIIAVVALLLFGGTRLAGIGKSAGKAIREFKEETSTLKSEAPTEPTPPAVEPPAQPSDTPAPETERERESEA